MKVNSKKKSIINEGIFTIYNLLKKTIKIIND